MYPLLLPLPQQQPMLKALLLSFLLYLALSCADPNCKSCPLDLNQCEQCKNGFYLNKTCQPCTSIPNCSTCNYNQTTSKTTCTKCSNSYTVNQTSNTCVSCTNSTPNCNKCTVNSSQPSTTYCTECNSQAVMVGTQCKICAEVIGGCRICSDIFLPVNCVSCLSGYFTNSDQSQCLPCGSLIQDCDTCEFQAPYQPVKCTTCADSYNLSKDHHSCDKSNLTTIIIAVIVPIAVIVVIGAVLWIYWRKKKRAKQSEQLMEEQDNYEKVH